MKIKITESQYKLIVEEKEYFEQLKQLIINNNFDLAVEVSKAVGINIDEVIKDLLIGEHHAFSYDNYDFTYEIYKIQFNESDDKTIILLCNNIDGGYYGYDDYSDELNEFDIFELLEYDIEFVNDFISESIESEFEFLENFNIQIIINT